MKESIRITKAEWEIMAAVWERAPIAASAIAGLLEEKRQWTLATVRTLLRRLVNKGALEQRQEGKRFVYSPRVSMEECAGDWAKRSHETANLCSLRRRRLPEWQIESSHST